MISKKPGGGGDAEFEVSVPQLKDVFEDLRAFRKYLAGQIQDAETTVMRLGADWSGQARDAHRGGRARATASSDWFLARVSG